VQPGADLVGRAAGAHAAANDEDVERLFDDLGIAEFSGHLAYASQSRLFRITRLFADQFGRITGLLYAAECKEAGFTDLGDVRGWLVAVGVDGTLGGGAGRETEALRGAVAKPDRPGDGVGVAQGLHAGMPIGTTVGVMTALNGLSRAGS
jgi:hypothetical protein